MEQKIEKGIGWLEKLLKMEEKYGFFRFLRVLLLLLLTGFVILTITNPRYVLDKVESIQVEQHDESVAKRIQVDADIRLMLRKLLYALDADRTWLIGDSGFGIHFLFAIVELSVFVQVSHGIFDGVADLLPVDVEPADGIGRLHCDAFQK